MMFAYQKCYRWIFQFISTFNGHNVMYACSSGRCGQNNGNFSLPQCVTEFNACVDQKVVWWNNHRLYPDLWHPAIERTRKKCHHHHHSPNNSGFIIIHSYFMYSMYTRAHRFSIQVLLITRYGNLCVTKPPNMGAREHTIHSYVIAELISEIFNFLFWGRLFTDKKWELLRGAIELK